MSAHIAPQRTKWLLALMTIGVLSVLFLLSSPVATPQPFISIAEETVGFLIHTPTCRIPQMDPFDRGIAKYIHNRSRLICSKYEPLVLSNETSIWINEVSLEQLGVELDDVTCCYQVVMRKHIKDDDKAMVPADDDIKVNKTCVRFFESTQINNEFIRVTCTLENETHTLKDDQPGIYKDFHSFILPKKNFSENIDPELKPSVLIIGIDAVSRLNFYRQLPETLEQLQKMEAIEFLGYNKVADNTFPNLVPVLMGKTVEEISKTCWLNNSVFDNCPFIWKNYSQQGYVTGFGEDACWMGIFQYVKKGFFRQPVDYYMHTLISKAENEIGFNKKMNAKLCVGWKTAANMLFDNAEKFAVTLSQRKTPYFGFFWGASLTHDYLNVPRETDQIYKELLKSMKEKGALKNTIVIVMSDHGIRWGPIRETYQGRIEERLPLIFFLLPDWFKEKYSYATSMLRRNRKMLTSPFDIYETLKDLLHVSSLDKESLDARQKTEVSSRGISLFSPVPKNRTCITAGIPDNWCTCHESQNVSTNDTIVKQAAKTIVDFLNHKLFPYIQCSNLSLKQILSAQMESSTETVSANTKNIIRDITVVLVTSPGGGTFEATVRHLQPNEPPKVLGYVSRINTYGNQSRCVNDFHMKLYCFCL